MRADAFDTALMVLGTDEGMALATKLNLAALDIDTFIGGAAFTAGDGVVEVRFDTAARQVQADINDDGVFGAGDLEINLLFDSTGVATGDLILT